MGRNDLEPLTASAQPGTLPNILTVIMTVACILSVTWY